MYDDIIDTVYPFDLNHKRMSEYDRCKQFMPFSALVGYKEAVSETARITSNKIILDEDARKILDDKLNIIKDKLSFNLAVTITYFIPDKYKFGGDYTTVSGFVKKIDIYNNFLIINGKKVYIYDIIDINFC